MLRMPPVAKFFTFWLHTMQHIPYYIISIWLTSCILVRTCITFIVVMVSIICCCLPLSHDSMGSNSESNSSQNSKQHSPQMAKWRQIMYPLGGRRARRKGMQFSKTAPKKTLWASIWESCADVSIFNLRLVVSLTSSQSTQRLDSRVKNCDRPRIALCDANERRHREVLQCCCLRIHRSRRGLTMDPPRYITSNAVVRPSDA
jgi:hypothetical protein